MKKHILKGFILGMALFLFTLSPVQAKMSFKKLKNVTFIFANGIGSWCTELTIKKDGSFQGIYHDNDVEPNGRRYPNGTCYYCSFHGKFTEMQKVDSYTYLFFIDELELDHEPGEVEYADDMRYVYSEPMGLDEADDLLLYLPKAPLDELPEEFLFWAGHPARDWEEGETLSAYGLYNVNAEKGFVGYKEVAQEESLPHVIEIEDGLDLGIGLELQEAEEKGGELENLLNTGTFPQQEMNKKAAELFDVWDTALENVWQRLGEILDPSTMKSLSQEEQAWLEKRDEEGEAAAKGYGGTIAPYLRMTTKARLTRAWVNFLAETYGYNFAY